MVILCKISKPDSMADMEKYETENERDDFVFCLDCSYCRSRLCNRAMKSFLVADAEIELFSTDEIDNLYVDLTEEKYRPDVCQCLVQNLACLQCGNVIGYFVKMPCRECLQSPNNGHYWMFDTKTIVPSKQINQAGKGSVTWLQLLKSEEACVLNSSTCWEEECER